MKTDTLILFLMLGAIGYFALTGRLGKLPGMSSQTTPSQNPLGTQQTTAPTDTAGQILAAMKSAFDMLGNFAQSTPRTT
jgi:hypothetical protein